MLILFSAVYREYHQIQWTSFRQINIHNKLWSAAVFQEPQMFVNIHAWTQKFVTLHLEKIKLTPSDLLARMI